MPGRHALIIPACSPVTTCVRHASLHAAQPARRQGLVAAPDAGAAGPLRHPRPAVAVLLFLAAIISAFWYLRNEEFEREQESVKRDTEIAQQQMRLRLIESQEQLVRIAREIATRAIDADEFVTQATELHPRTPRDHATEWVMRIACASLLLGAELPRRDDDSTDERGPSAPVEGRRSETELAFSAARDLRQPVYSRPVRDAYGTPVFQVQMPLIDRGNFAGTLIGEYSIDGLMRYGIPAEVASRQRSPARRARERAGRQHGHAEAGREKPWAPVHRIRGAGLAGRQRHRAARPGLSHLDRADRQQACSGWSVALGADGLDADRHLAPHAPPAAGAAGAGGRNQLPPRDGELHADRHARARPAKAASPTSTRPSAP